uniref:Mitochondrial import inner membrane translocase subunit n=1 Tax=Ditylum brightwellii TaxID=49249 RepID=A0A7S4R3S7_9STRA
MGWFGGSSSGSDSSASSSSDFSSNTDFTSADESDFGSSSASLGGGGGGGVSDIQQFSVALRQQIVVQQVITSLTDTAFERCITGKPGENLSSKETACIHASVAKWLDSNEFMMGRLAKKQQQSQQGQFH